ncbi:MAG: amidohydrolase family protein, partial [Dehalococcoidia bacterium]|nr:amidohydrolase family protein [Dehalococcoidia bacterium]
MAQEQLPDLVFSTARVITMEPQSPTAQSVAVKGDKILWVGSTWESHRFKGPHTKEIDCQGMALMPGFNDAHIHLLALTSRLRWVDCRSDNVGSISQIVDEIGHWARRCKAGEWVRAFGYDEFNLAEKRHPNRWDLDRATRAHPVRLDHRTGHASVL